MLLSSRVCASLSAWITFLLRSVWSRAHRTLVELLMASMLNPEGWVTRAIGAITRGAHWTTYYQLIERAHVDGGELAAATLRLILQVCPQELPTVIIDDTWVPRGSQQAAGVKVRFDHSHKNNRPTYLNCQCWVTLALVVRVKLGAALVVPLRSMLVTETGQRGKLFIAKTLLQSLRPQLEQVRLLIDSWYMRCSLIAPLLAEDVRIIGQVRRDTALFAPPEPEPTRRGRKRKYGQRLTATVVQALPVQEVTLPLYGKEQTVRLRSCIALARFLKGHPVRVVWCEMLQANGEWSTPRLILATETYLSAVQVVRPLSAGASNRCFTT